MNSHGFTEKELVPYIGMLVLVFGILIVNYRKGYQHVWSPLTIIAVVFGYYCLLGPYQGVSSGDTYDRLVNMRKYYVSSFWGAFIALLFCTLGFLAHGYKIKKSLNVQPTNEDLKFYGIRVFIFGFILFAIAKKGNVLSLVNPLDAEAGESLQGGLASYFSYSINFLIVGTSLLLVYYLRTKRLMWLFVGCFLLSFALYTTLGFRYRLVLLVGAVVIPYYLIKSKRPNLVLTTIGVFVFVVFMGIMSITRQYGRGLDLSLLKGKNQSTQSYYENGLSEAKIFQTSGAVMDLVSQRGYPHAGFEPIVSTVLFPIPRSIFSEKPAGEYVFNILDAIYGKKASKGAAFMMYAEYYLAFGWLGLMVGSFFIGWFYKKLWLWYLTNSRNPLVVIAYSVTVSYLYVIISRGYLPQVTMLFFFSVFPIYVVIRLVKKKHAPTLRNRVLQHAN